MKFAQNHFSFFVPFSVSERPPWSLTFAEYSTFLCCLMPAIPSKKVSFIDGVICCGHFLALFSLLALLCSSSITFLIWFILVFLFGFHVCISSRVFSLDGSILDTQLHTIQVSFSTGPKETLMWRASQRPQTSLQSEPLPPSFRSHCLKDGWAE